jgi:hypothetical protein
MVSELRVPTRDAPSQVRRASEALYRHPPVLWLLCPVLLYWISRAWFLAHRGEMDDDPVVFATTERVSRLLLILAVIIVFGAI